MKKIELKITTKQKKKSIKDSKKITHNLHKMTQRKRRLLQDSVSANNVDEYLDKNVKIKLRPWRNEFIDNCIFKFFLLNRRNKKRIDKRENAIQVWSRRSTIPSYLIDCFVRIHNGQHFVTKKISPEMIGHKFGQYSFTRKIYRYQKQKKKK
jgi:small subunit ribosomal protein S19